MTDLELGTPDERWYYDAEKGGWIASAIVRGNAPGSSPLRPPTTTPNPPGDNPPASSTAATPGKQREYRVRPGDTLSAIALRELGNANRWSEIKKNNGSRFTEVEARSLQVGQSIYLPVSYGIGTGIPATINTKPVVENITATRSLIYPIIPKTVIPPEEIGDDNFSDFIIIYPRNFTGIIPPGGMREGEFTASEFQPSKQSSTLPLALIKIGLITTQVDSPAPGPADILGGAIVLSGLAAGLVLLASSYILDQDRIAAPQNLIAFPNARLAKSKTIVRKGGGERRRWRDQKAKEIFEWDYQHGTVEKYNTRGKHLGEFDATTGKQLKPANPARKMGL